MADTSGVVRETIAVIEKKETSSDKYFNKNIRTIWLYAINSKNRGGK